VQVSAIPSVHDTMMKVYHAFLKQLETVFQNLGVQDATKEARLLGAILDGISIQYMLDTKNFPLEEMKEMIIDKYLNNEKYTN